MDESSSPDYEFGGFRLDTALQVLISPSGEPLALPSRAFATLRYLVERAGEVVDKSTLMSAVWPKTVVAENNLNQCILALRKTLGESAGERRFILTVPGRGFKFVTAVTVVPHERFATATTPAPAVPGEVARDGYRGAWRLVIAGVVAIVLVGAGLWLWPHRQPGAVTFPEEYVQLTDVTDSATAPALSPDGHMLAFVRDGIWFKGSGQIWVQALPNGEAVKLTDSREPVWAPAFTPDSTHVVYSSVDLRHGSWDTWTVPVTGGAPATKILPNAQALTYIGPREVLYSEFNIGSHVSVATSLDDRSNHRDVYVPVHERGMAHYSYLSPDRKSVLVVEMNASGIFDRCRLTPFDGRGPGYAVGPLYGSCIGAAWSPDGKWMYFSNLQYANSHLWRQRFPDGVAEQITFGPDEEQTVFAMPDGHSLLTSIGLTQSRLWFHNASGDRILTTEGRVLGPWLSSDAQRVYYLMGRGPTSGVGLARMQTSTGSQESLVPGFNSMIGFDVSPDEQQVVFCADRGHGREIWVAPLDRHAPPLLLAQGADEPAFGGGYVFFRRIGEHASYLHRIKIDGSGESQLLSDPIIEFYAVAPDGKAVVVTRPSPDSLFDAWAIPIDSASPARIINKGYSPSKWSHDGKLLYVGLNVQEHVALTGSSVVLPTGPDDLPLSKSLAATTGAPLIPHQGELLAVSSDPSVYVFLKYEERRNIYRIPLH